MFTDKGDPIEPDITETFVSGEVDINSVKYQYSYEGQVAGADRAFAYQTEFDSSSHLFELTPKDGDMTTYTQILESVSMQDPQIYEKLISTGRSIVDTVEKEMVTKETPLNFFSKEIELNGKQFVVKYASPHVQVAGVSLREFYEKRLKRRIVV